MTITATDIERKCIECSGIFSGLTLCPHDGALLIEIQKDALVGTTIGGHYEILSLLGHGGMGVVYKARHNVMDRIVAIKMLRSQLISEKVVLRRFQQEVKASSRINHPHVITVHDYGVSGGMPYIVMDYLKGDTLSQLLDREEHLGVERGLKILTQACDGLAFAHKQGVVHRDLKPGNIVLINYDGDPDFVKVVDFGVARILDPSLESQRLTQDGEVLGSPLYMSPEQCMGQELGPQSDIYAMGIVIYETLTGCLPIIGKTAVETIAKQVTEQPVPFATVRPDLYIPERLQQIVFKAMAKDLNTRYQSMEQLRDDLEVAIPRPGRSAVLRSADVTASSARDQPKSEGSRKKILLASAISTILIACGAAFVSPWRTGVLHLSPSPAPLKSPAATEQAPSKPPSSEMSAIIAPDANRKVNQNEQTHGSQSGTNSQPQTSSQSSSQPPSNGQPPSNSQPPAVGTEHTPDGKSQSVVEAHQSNEPKQSKQTVASVNTKDATEKRLTPETPKAHVHAVVPKQIAASKQKASASKADPWGNLRSHFNQYRNRTE